MHASQAWLGHVLSSEIALMAATLLTRLDIILNFFVVGQTTRQSCGASKQQLQFNDSDCSPLLKHVQCWAVEQDIMSAAEA